MFRIHNKNFSINWDEQLTDNSKVISVLKLLKLKNVIFSFDKTFFGSVYDYYHNHNRASDKQINSIRKAVLKRYIKELNIILYKQYGAEVHELLKDFVFVPSDLLHEEVHGPATDIEPSASARIWVRPCPCCGENVYIENRFHNIETGFCIYCGISIEYDNMAIFSPS